MATTRPGQYGVGLTPYSGFSPKTPASSPKSEGQVTRLTSMGIGGKRRIIAKGNGPFTRLTTIGINGRRVEFSPKAPSTPSKGSGQFTRLLSFGIGGKTVVFTPKTPATPSGKGEGPFTRLLTYGIGGKIAVFDPKKAAETRRGGGAKKVRKKYTDEEIKGMEDYGLARLGITKEPEAPDTILSPEAIVSPDTIVSPEEIIAPETFIPGTSLADESLVSIEETASPIGEEISILKEESVSDELLLILSIMAAHDS